MGRDACGEPRRTISRHINRQAKGQAVFLAMGSAGGAEDRGPGRKPWEIWTKCDQPSKGERIRSTCVSATVCRPAGAALRILLVPSTAVLGYVSAAPPELP